MDDETDLKELAKTREFYIGLLLAISSSRKKYSATLRLISFLVIAETLKQCFTSRLIEEEAVHS